MLQPFVIKDMCLVKEVSGLSNPLTSLQENLFLISDDTDFPLCFPKSLIAMTKGPSFVFLG